MLLVFYLTLDDAVVSEYCFLAYPEVLHVEVEHLLCKNKNCLGVWVEWNSQTRVKKTWVVFSWKEE